MILKLLIVGVVIGGVVWLARGLLGPREAPFPCATCRHCKKLFDDGAMCAYGSKQTFKNPAQIGMCPDHEPR